MSYRSLYRAADDDDGDARYDAIRSGDFERARIEGHAVQWDGDQHEDPDADARLREDVRKRGVVPREGVSAVREECVDDAKWWEVWT